MLKPGKDYNDGEDALLVNIEIPKLLSLMGYRSANAFVPGVKDLIDGGYEYTDANGNKQIAISAEEKIKRGKLAIAALAKYKKHKEEGEREAMAESKAVLDENFKYFGYGFLNNTDSLIPNVPLCYYSFRVMVGLGFLFLLVFIVALWKMLKSKTEPNLRLLAKPDTPFPSHSLVSRFSHIF